MAKSHGSVYPPQGRIAVLTFFVLALLVWAALTSFVMTASRVWLNQLNLALRQSVIARKIFSTEALQSNPWWLDLAYHLAFYAPFGVFAVMAGRIARRWWPASEDKAELVARVTCLIGAALFALTDEIRQIPLPDRSADPRDLVAGWAGIMLGALVCSVLHFAYRKVYPARHGAKVDMAN